MSLISRKPTHSSLHGEPHFKVIHDIISLLQDWNHSVTKTGKSVQFSLITRFDLILVTPEPRSICIWKLEAIVSGYSFGFQWRLPLIWPYWNIHSLSCPLFPTEKNGWDYPFSCSKAQGWFVQGPYKKGNRLNCTLTLTKPNCKLSNMCYFNW